MATRAFKVNVDQWGHTPGFAKGTTLLINDDDPESVMYSVEGSDPKPFAGDVPWALGNGSIIELDEDGQPLGSERRGLLFPTGRLPVGDEKALDRGAPSGDTVPIPSGQSGDEAPLTQAENPTPDASGASDEGLTPAQKAARTRAERAAAAGSSSSPA